MADKAKLNLLDEELDEESQKTIKEALETWKESVTNQIMEQMEQEKQAKIEQLEEANLEYREQLREEYTEKMLDGLNELKESIRAEVTAEVIKNNPELKILESVKEAVAPLISENYRDNAYEDTLTKLAEENSSLKREIELREGAETLANLIRPYSNKTRKILLSMIEEGSPEEVSERFYDIVENISELFEEDDKEDSDEDEDDEDEEKSKKDDSEDEDDEDVSDEDDDEDDEDDSEEDEDKAVKEESYINEGFSGEERSKKTYTILDEINEISRL